MTFSGNDWDNKNFRFVCLPIQNQLSLSTPFLISDNIKLIVFPKTSRKILLVYVFLKYLHVFLEFKNVFLYFWEFGHIPNHVYLLFISPSRFSMVPQHHPFSNSCLFDFEYPPSPVSGTHESFLFSFEIKLYVYHYVLFFSERSRSGW